MKRYAALAIAWSAAGGQTSAPNVFWQIGEVEHSQVTFAIDGNGVARSFRVEYLGDTATFRR